MQVTNVDLILFDGGEVARFLHVFAVNVLLEIVERDVEVEGPHSSTSN